MNDAIIISDIHLGSPTSQTQMLERFLYKIKNKTKKLILNGDVFDSWDFDREFIIYGLESEYTYKNCEFKRMSAIEFVKDLNNCERIISTAGNQLICEADFLNKPIFVIPIPRQAEQLINAINVKIKKIGDYCELEKLELKHIQKFIRTDFHNQSIVASNLP